MFAALEVPHARDAIKGKALMAALKTAGAFLLNQRLEGQIAVTTLHGHFPVPADQALLGRVNVVDREIKTSLVPVSEVRPELETAWGFTPGGKPVVLGWTDDAYADPHMTEGVHKVGAFFAFEKLTTFLAIVDCRESFDLGPDEILLERTDEAARTQLTTVVKRSDIPPDQVAVWCFKWDGPDEMRGRIRPEDVVPLPWRGCDAGC